MYFFYKNVVLITPICAFGFSSLFSTESIFDSWLLMSWNMVFTAVSDSLAPLAPNQEAFVFRFGFTRQRGTKTWSVWEEL
jgi:hypothetical protein